MENLFQYLEYQRAGGSCKIANNLVRHQYCDVKIPMPIYWTAKDIPELSQLPANERALAWRSVYRKTFRHWQTWAGLFACCACTIIGMYVSNPFGYHAVVGAALGAGLGGFLFSQSTIYVARRYYFND